jgi:hypothetical protein
MTITQLETLYGSIDIQKPGDLVRAIRTAYTSGEVSKLDLVTFLDRSIDAFLPEARRICASYSDASEADRSALVLHGLLLAGEMIVLCEMRSCRQLRDRTLLFLEFASSAGSSPHPFVEMAVRVLRRDISSTGFTWGKIESANSLDVLSYHFFGGVNFAKAEIPFSFTGKGVVEVQDGRLTIRPTETAEVDAFGLFNDSVLVRTPKHRDLRLKQTEKDEITPLRSFFKGFSDAQQQYVPPRTEDPAPVAGDIVDLQCLGVDRTGSPVLSVIGHEEIQGGLAQEELVHYVWTDMVKDYLFTGDCILGARLKASNGTPCFSIAESYETFARKAANEYLRSGRQFEARAVRIFDKYDRVGWLTAAGFGGVSLREAGVKEGMVRVMEVESVKGVSDTYINLRPPKNGIADDYDCFITGDEAGGDILEKFITDRESVLARRQKAKTVRDDSMERASLIKLARILAGRFPGLGTIECLRSLMAASFLAAVAGDTALVELLSVRIDILSALAAYAQGVPFSLGGVESKIPEAWQRRLSCIACGRDELGRENLQELLRDPDPLCKQVAGLLFAGAISEVFRDQVQAEPDVVRKKVCALLGVEDAFRGMESRRSGKYGMTESDDVEFKSSYVFRNDNGRPDIDYQGRGQVFEAVCAFLNKDGGEVYVGVGDNGDPILSEGYGLNADIAWIQENYRMLNGKRSPLLGHSIPVVNSVESLSRFLRTEKELYFSEDIQKLIDINPTEDADAIRITVHPSQYEIAYLYSNRNDPVDGVAYVRDGSSTVKMTNHDKQMRLMNLKRVSREIGFIVTIREAIDRHQKLIFKRYASGNRRELRDRLVVPVNLFYNDENVSCFDIGSKKYKQFRLQRIESIEALDEVYTIPLQPAKKNDVFRWLNEGKGQYHIRLRLDVLAHNCLLEEYSCAKDLPKEELYMDGPNHWILDTVVYGWDAVRRFYLGLAANIEILDSEDSDALKANIRSYIEANLDVCPPPPGA